MRADELLATEVIESIMTAQSIAMILRSRSPHRSHASEKLYVIKSFSYDGTPIYTKGKITKQAGKETVYILISAKITWTGD